MAGNAVIGALRIDLGMNAGEFERGARSAETRAGALKRNLDQLSPSHRKLISDVSAAAGRLAAFAGSFLAVSRAMRVIQNSFADISSIDRLSQATGISVERLDSLRQAAAQSNVEFQTLMQVVSTFGGRMTEVVNNPASRGAEALRVLGISIRNADGSLRNFDQVLPQIADAFRATRTAPTRARWRQHCLAKKPARA